MADFFRPWKNNFFRPWKNDFFGLWKNASEFERGELFEEVCLAGNFELIQWCANQPDFKPIFSGRMMIDLVRHGRCDVIAWLFQRYKIPSNAWLFRQTVYDAMLLTAAQVGSLECMKLAADPLYYPNTPTISDWGAKNFDEALNAVVNCDACIAFLLDAQDRYDNYLQQREDNQRAYATAHRL